MSVAGGKATADAQAQAKVARQKKIVIVGSVILVILLAWQGPKTVKQLRAKAPTSPSASSDAPTAASPTAPSALKDTDKVDVQPGSGQLVSFGLFKAKDPFVQQVSAQQAPGPSAASAATAQPAAPPAATAPVQTTPTTAPPPQPPAPEAIPAPVVQPTTPVTPPPAVPTPPASPSTVALPTTPKSTRRTKTPPPPAPTPTPTQRSPSLPPPPPVPASSVAVTTNGRCEVVPLNGTFPGNADIFRITAIGKNADSVKIAIVGGSYESGAPAVTLERGKALTLVNTADGLRYTLRLVKDCSGSPGAVTPPVAPPPPPPPPAAPATTTATTTTSTVTTPTSTTPTSTTPTSTTSTTSTTP